MNHGHAHGVARTGGAVRPRARRARIAGVMALALPGGVFAQTDPHAVQPERPTVATHAGTVAPGWLEIETGIESDRFEGGSRQLQNPNVLKIGLAQHAQLNIGLPLIQVPHSALGPGDASVGLKWRLLEHARLLGDFALLPTVKFSTGSASAGRGSGTTDFSLLAISSHSFGGTDMDINAGFTHRGGDGAGAPVNSTLWAASIGFPIAAALGGVAELYGFPKTSGASGQPGIVALLTGPTYLAAPSLALDAGVIVPFTGPQPRALYAGLVWNVGRLGPAERGRSRPMIPPAG
jgi:hypothetical protein